MNTRLIRLISCLCLIFFISAIADAQPVLKRVRPKASRGWVRLFDGKSLKGWRVSENPDTFTVKDGQIIAHGPRAHLFYNGSIRKANFKDFELKMDVLTKPGSNSGIFIHTAYQKSDWPEQGYECQINNTHSDPIKTASIYGVENVDVSAARDNEWFNYHLIVQGNRIIIKINERTVVDFTEPKSRIESNIKNKLSSGTIALQGHDPKSEVHFKNIMLRPLTGGAYTEPEWSTLFDEKEFDELERLNGSATFAYKNGNIVATSVKGSTNTYLRSKRYYSDFELSYEVKIDPRVNAGVQFRSNSVLSYQNGRVHGYQMELSADGNAGYIYDEARRGWINDNHNLQAAKSIFKPNEWNTCYVVCKDDEIRTWVNGSPVDYLKDKKTDTGFIALEIQAFNEEQPAEVAWRNVQIKEIPDTHFNARQRDMIKAVVVTGGHEFDREAFFAMFDSFRQIDYTEAVQTEGAELFEDISDWNYDVIIFYNMTKSITPKQQENFLQLLDDGVGIVVLHHALVAYQEWPEFVQISGAKYYESEQAGLDGNLHQASSFKHDVDMEIKVSPLRHPITFKINDFKIHDEVYKNMEHLESNHVLLTTDHPDSDVPIAWVREYKESKGRIFSYKSGHDARAYENNNFRHVLLRGIYWAAGQNIN